MGEVASTPQEVKIYASCTLLAASMTSEQPDHPGAAQSQGAIEACMDWLMDNEFIHIQKEGDGEETLGTADVFDIASVSTCEGSCAFLLQKRSIVLLIWVLPHCHHLYHLRKLLGFLPTYIER